MIHRPLRYPLFPYTTLFRSMPEMYADIWTAAKGMYKVEPAVADGGEVIIYAPHIDEISYTHGQQLDEIGYHRSEEHTSELQSLTNLVCRLLLEKKKKAKKGK